MGNNTNDEQPVLQKEKSKKFSRRFTSAGGSRSKSMRQSIHVMKLQWNKLLEEKGKDEQEDYTVLEIIGVGSISTISKIQKKKPQKKEQTSSFGCFPSLFSSSKKEYAIYALKQVDLSSQTKQFLAELRNEIDILKSLDHPNILKAFETFEKENYLSIVMELCEGGDLRSRQPYTEKQAAIITNKITSAVAYMHENNIVHRDLKFENIMFETSHPDSEIKIIDFGLSKKVKDHDQIIKGQTGSVYTMAPEVIKGTYTIKADIWSVGVLSYMLLSEYLPFPGTNRKEIESAILEGKFNFDDDKWNNISKEAKDFISNLLEYDAEKRVSAREAQELGWLKGEFLMNDHKLQNSVMKKICHNLIKYSNEKDFRKLVLNIIAHKATVDEVSRLRQAFEEFDSNNDGTIKYSEYEGILSKFGYSEKEIQKSFSSVIMNNNGVIAYTEFVAATLESQGHIKESRIEDAFERLDSDKSGYVTKENLCDLLGSSCSGSLVEKFVKEFDTNGDGRISYSEFSNQFHGHPTV